MTNVLIIGAGAVGQAYGHCLSMGGARVSYLVKPEQAERCRSLRVYALRRWRAPRASTFAPAEILTTASEVRQQRWDQAWLCVATPALEHPSLGPVLDALGDGGATVVHLQPGGHVHSLIERHVPTRQIVAGAIGLVSYQAPLPGQQLKEPGIAYAFGLGSRSLFSGERGRTNAVVHALRRGGAKAAVTRDSARWVALTGAVIQPLVVALESVGWSIATLRRSAALRLGSRAMREALDLEAHALGFRAPFVRNLLRPWLLSLLLWVAPVGFPFDVESYLRAHFTKVRPQTRLLMLDYLSRPGDPPSSALAELAASAWGPTWAEDTLRPQARVPT